MGRRTQGVVSESARARARANEDGTQGSRRALAERHPRCARKSASLPARFVRSATYLGAAPFFALAGLKPVLKLLASSVRCPR